MNQKTESNLPKGQFDSVVKGRGYIKFPIECQEGDSIHINYEVTHRPENFLSNRPRGIHAKKEKEIDES